jgi:ribulose-5-phosphate 4-epimerase/fuculose-1-phosphate aldolase
MTVAHALPVVSLKDQVSAAEWQTRVDLAACYRLIALYGWDDLIFTHISAKIPGSEDFLINPYGLMFHEITASSLVKIDLAGNKLMDSPFDINPAGYTIHSAVHEVRHDVGCVLHIHTPQGIAVSAQKQGLLPLSQQSLFVLASLAYHGYEGVALNHDEKSRLQADLGDKNFVNQVPVGVFHLVEGLVAQDTGVVHHHIDAAKGVQGALHDLLAVGH